MAEGMNGGEREREERRRRDMEMKSRRRTGENQKDWRREEAG